jgi:branched-chain amino acid transport system permease protein
MEISAELIIFVRDFAIFFAIYLTVALSLNLEYGYTGVPNFGKVLAVAGGAFVVGSIPGRIAAWLFNIGPGLDYITDNTEIVTEVNQVLMKNPAASMAIFFVTLVIAGAVGAILGLISCYPAIRLREDYLAITLLAMGEGIQVIGYNYSPIIKGNIGVLVPDPFGWAGDFRYAVIAVFIVGVCLAVSFYFEHLVRSPLGRMLRAIRDNENVAESLGKDVTRTRMKTIIVAATIGSIAGALDAFKAGGVISTSYQRTTWTFWPWVIVILGGAGNNVGVVAGTFVFTALRRFIDYYKGYLAPFLPFNVVWLDPLLLGVMLILIQMYRPEGIIKEKPTPTLSYKRIKEIISSKTTGPPSRKED